MDHTCTGSAQGRYVPVGSGGGQELKMTVLSALARSHFPLSKVCVSHGLGEVYDANVQEAATVRCSRSSEAPHIEPGLHPGTV